MQVTPYLYFDGRCEEAIEFYKKALGAQVMMLMRFKECPEPGMSKPELAQKIMHATIRIGETPVHLSDGRCEAKTHFDGFSLSLNASDPAEAERLFAAIGEGGKVTMPLTKTFFSPAFGMLADRFGVMWMVIVQK